MALTNLWRAGMFDLKRPCASCPFRKGKGSAFRLTAQRLAEIRRGVSFQCHKTVDYDEWDDDIKRQGERPQQCAGLMALLHRHREQNQITQVAVRMGVLDPAQLDPKDEAYATWRDALNAHLRGIEP
jgi:hypothetical protein